MKIKFLRSVAEMRCRCCSTPTSLSVFNAKDDAISCVFIFRKIQLVAGYRLPPDQKHPIHHSAAQRHREAEYVSQKEQIRNLFWLFFIHEHFRKPSPLGVTTRICGTNKYECGLQGLLVGPPQNRSQWTRRCLPLNHGSHLYTSKLVMRRHSSTDYMYICAYAITRMVFIYSSLPLRVRATRNRWRFLRRIVCFG